MHVTIHAAVKLYFQRFYFFVIVTKIALLMLPDLTATWFIVRQCMSIREGDHSCFVQVLVLSVSVWPIQLVGSA